MKKIVIILLCVMMLTACQPTPEDYAVKSKAGEDLMDKILAGITDEYEINSTNKVLGIEKPLLYLNRYYENEYTDSGKRVTISIDADVYMPVEEKIPVAKVARADFTQETVDRAISIFTKGEPVCEEYLTKDMIESQILLVKQKIATYDGSQSVSPEQLETALEYLIIELENADEDLESSDVDILNSNEIIFHQGLFDGNIVQIIIDARKCNPLGQSIGITAARGYMPLRGICNYFGMLSMPEALLDSIEIKFDEKTALDKATETIIVLGAANMSLYNSDIAVQSDCILNPEYDINDITHEIKGAYYFEFKREINNVPTSDTIYIQNKMEGEAGYSPIWKDEKITVVVNEKGIIDFEWQSPSKVTQVLNDDVEIIGFEESIDIAMQQMSNSLWSYDGIISQTLRINKITLDLAKIKIKDLNDEYMYVPVWKFYGDLWIKYTEEYMAHPDAPREDTQCWNEDGELYCSHAKDYPFLIINAVDGTIINPYTGY